MWDPDIIKETKSMAGYLVVIIFTFEFELTYLFSMSVMMGFKFQLLLKMEVYHIPKNELATLLYLEESSMWGIIGLYFAEDRIVGFSPKMYIRGMHISTWIVNPINRSFHFRYFVLLAKHADGNKGLTPLPYIMNLLLRKQTHRSVTTAVMELVERLLTLQDHQEEVNEDTYMAPDIPVQQKLHVDSETVLRLSSKQFSLY